MSDYCEMMERTKVKDRCPCGGIILADTEEWKTPLCNGCFEAIGSPRNEPDQTSVVVVSENGRIVGVTTVRTALDLRRLVSPHKAADKQDAADFLREEKEGR